MPRRWRHKIAFSRHGAHATDTDERGHVVEAMNPRVDLEPQPQHGSAHTAALDRCEMGTHLLGDSLYHGCAVVGDASACEEGDHGVAHALHRCVLQAGRGVT